jgi:sulfur carrier protein
MVVTVNGERRELPPGATVAGLVELVAAAPDGRGVAIALADEVVPRAAWETTELADGDRVEIVVAVQGG